MNCPALQQPVVELPSEGLSPPRRGMVRAVLLGLVCGAALAWAWEAAFVFCGPNFYAVVPGAAYRSAQPSPAWLRRVMAEHGIRTVVNLRGEGRGTIWYDDEHQTVTACGGTCEDIMFSASFPPRVQDLQRLVRVLDTAPRPVLLHCHSGSDRSGLAAAIYLLLYTQTPLPETYGQLSWRYGHFSLGHKACQTGVLDQYAGWLASEQLQHSAEHFRHWVQYAYHQEL